MRRLTALALTVVTLTAVGRAAAGDEQQKPKWQDCGNRVTVFGNVDRAGFYTITDRPISLAQLVNSAGMRPGKGVVVILQRATANGANTIQVDAARLKEDGDIPLLANDVVQVTAPKAG